MENVLVYWTVCILESGFGRVYAGKRFTGGKYGWKCIKENV